MTAAHMGQAPDSPFESQVNYYLLDGLRKNEVSTLWFPGQTKKPRARPHPPQQPGQAPDPAACNQESGARCEAARTEAKQGAIRSVEGWPKKRKAKLCIDY